MVANISPAKSTQIHI